jgi:hypothetical protein
MIPYFNRFDQPIAVPFPSLNTGFSLVFNHQQRPPLSHAAVQSSQQHPVMPPLHLAVPLLHSVVSLPHPLNSRIISNFPERFAEFRVKHFEKLWRGSRDGFGASAFHRRCDGHANTLTMILDTKGNIFGDFTPKIRTQMIPARWVTVSKVHFSH